ncbi:MAG: hypothetical protein MZV64_09280 [Ignavibacteriales bacterium]|nr:hypothetical protein [Ignavibacteriales bacterium]
MNSFYGVLGAEGAATRIPPRRGRNLLRPQMAALGPGLVRRQGLSGALR